MSLMERLKRLFSRKEIPTEARDLLAKAETPKELLVGLDQLITRNELEVNNITGEIEALETIEAQEIGKVKGGELPERSKNNVLRKIKRLRKQMDNLEERQQIYNRNINLQIHLVGKIQALDAMELRGVDEERIDDILADYEDELSRYQSVIESEEFSSGEIGNMLDDTHELQGLEAEILGGSEGSVDADRSAASHESEPRIAPPKSIAEPRSPEASDRASDRARTDSSERPTVTTTPEKPRESTPRGKESE